MSYRFDEMLFHPKRLELMQLLDMNGVPCRFIDLRNLLKMTDGNLSSHLRALQKHGIVEISKTFNKNKPETKVVLSDKGRREFDLLKIWFQENFLEI